MTSISRTVYAIGSFHGVVGSEPAKLGCAASPLRERDFFDLYHESSRYLKRLTFGYAPALRVSGRTRWYYNKMTSEVV